MADVRAGFLSQYFDGVVMKRLSAVEADITKSHQHEFHGTVPLKKLLGPQKLAHYPARFMWLGGENEGITEESTITWYDARENHLTRTEYRLYFRDSSVMDMASANDLLIVARRPDGELYFLIAPAESTLERQLLWLFDAPEQIGLKFEHRTISGEHDVEIDYVVRFILEELGIEVQDSDIGFLDSHIAPYIERGLFPTTKEFSELARRIARGVSAVDDPDTALLEWMDLEERLFKRLERHIIAERLEQGFYEGSEVDIDGFIQFSLSVQNRRKSRVGHALENHLEAVFRAHQVYYSRTSVTEHKSKPDFLFPGIDQYKDNSFPTDRLTMLGVKSTCKDRWRQVLAEAARIKEKHLLTLEPGISENQTDEMQLSSLQLILPNRLHQTYKPRQQEWLVNVRDFVAIIKARQ